MILAFGEGGILIKIKKIELSSFKTLGGVISGSLKMIFWSLSKFACSAGTQNYIRYDIKSHLILYTHIYAYYKVPIHYAYYNVTIFAYYTAYYNVTIT